MQHSMLGLIFLTLLAAGCGGADQNSGSGGTGGETTTSSTTGTGGEAGANPTGGAGGMTNTGGSTGGANTGGSMGGTNTGGSTGGTGGAGGCQLLTEDASKIGASCENGVACPTGYTCHEFNGIAVTHTCAILCDQDCQCPQGTLCTMRSDKATSWKECVQP